MSVRNDITIDWTVSPRIITIAKDGVESQSISLQDLVDTLRSIEYQADTLAYEYLIDSFGKQALGGGVKVGITLVLNNAKLAFEARPPSTFVQCNISGGNLVAIDENGDDMDAVETTAYTQIIKTSSSSATLQELLDIQYSSFNEGVTIDVVNGVSGTVYPTGTSRQPVDNLADAQSITVARGFNKLYIVGDITIDASANLDNYLVYGQSTHLTMITFTTGCLTDGTEIYEATIQGTLDGHVEISDATILDLVNLDAHVFRSILKGEITLVGGTGSDAVQFIDCLDGLPGLGIPTINIGSGIPVGFWNWTGGLKLQNKDGSDSVSVNMVSGRLVLDSTVTAGTILVKGVGLCEDNSVGATVNTAGLVPVGVWEAVEAEIVRKMLENDVSKSGDIVTIYEDDGETIWRQYNVADGGRVLQ